MQIRFINPKLPKIHTYLLDFIKLYKSSVFSNYGEFLRLFEVNLQNYVKSNNKPVVLSNATIGLIVAFKSLQLPLGSKVIVPSFTFPATVLAVIWAGLNPVFCDIDKDTFNLDPEKVEDLLKKDSDISAICSMHCFGNPCDVLSFEKLSFKYNKKLIYDSAAAIGSSVNGVKIGNFGDAEVFSFHATKILPMGEGGAVVFKSKEHEDFARKMIDFGFNGDREVEQLGLNGKVSEFSAIIGLHSLKKLDKVLKKRNEIYKLYKEILNNFVESGLVKFQKIDDNNISSHQLLPIVCSNKEVRSKIQALLNSGGVNTKRYFYPPGHKHSFFSNLEVGDNLSNTDWLSDRVLCIPMWDDLNKKHLNYFSSILRKLV